MSVRRRFPTARSPDSASLATSAAALWQRREGAGEKHPARGRYFRSGVGGHDVLEPLQRFLVELNSLNLLPLHLLLRRSIDINLNVPLAISVEHAVGAAENQRWTGGRLRSRRSTGRGATGPPRGRAARREKESRMRAEASMGARPVGRNGLPETTAVEIAHPAP